MTAQVRVLIVDDSTTMRRLIRHKLAEDPRILIVGDAPDAAVARQRIAELKPDVVSLDVEMPGLSGLDFLSEIMQQAPLPVVMVSGVTQAGSASAIEALSRGAVDCVSKPANFAEADAFGNLADKLVTAARANIRQRSAANGSGPGRSAAGYHWNGRLLMIGASTGGVDALQRILESFPGNCPPTIVTQHMPSNFLESFASRLDNRLPMKVQLAQEGMVLRQGQVVIAQGDAHLTVEKTALSWRCVLSATEKRSGHRPSVDVMFESAVPFADRCVAAILTGMGYDGAASMLELRRHGARCIAQDEASSVVWGMPRVAFQNGAAESLVALDQIAPTLLELTGSPARRAGAA